MLTDEQHADLNNKMSPLINYFSLIEKRKTIEKEKLEFLNTIIENELELIYNIIPKILKILKHE